MMRGSQVLLRAYRKSDASDVQRLADDALVARWMTHAFPHPYTFADAEEWIAHATGAGAVNNFAIEVEGLFAGGIGIIPLHAEHAGVAKLGYWLGRPFWGRGVASDAAQVMVRYAFDTRGLRRLEAGVFAPNVASMKVLEKAGFRLEGILRESYVERDGTPVDAFAYGLLAGEGPG